MSGVTNINDPAFWDERNLNDIGTDAAISDFGPGPNETSDYVMGKSAAYRHAVESPGQYAPEPIPYQPPSYVLPVQQAPAESARMDALEAKIDKLLNALGGNNG